MDPGWKRALEPVRPELEAALANVQAENEAGQHILPPASRVFRAFERPFDAVRVVIVGQDPYPTPGHAVGLSFSVDPDVRPLPASLRNILTEWHDDLKLPMPANGDLSPWADEGVLLLNRALTVRAGQAGSHAKIGWEPVTRRAIEALVERGGPLVAILWGAHAQSLTPMLGDVPIIASPHPSPLSAHRGFFGSRPFSRSNAALIAQGTSALSWALHSAAEV
ncbi:MAG: uracil-DNA glycosylase [Microbacteriaceae bacterium]